MMNTTTKVYNKFFWQKVAEAGFEPYYQDYKLTNELYRIVADSIEHPDGNAVDYIEKHVNDVTFSIIKLNFVTDDNAIQVAFLLNQFGLKINRQFDYYVVVK